MSKNEINNTNTEKKKIKKPLIRQRWFKVLFSGIGAGLVIFILSLIFLNPKDVNIINKKEDEAKPVDAIKPKDRIQRTINISGYVYDDSIANPIRNAVIKIDQLTCETDSTGYFTIDLITSKEADAKSYLYVSKNGLQLDRKLVTLNDSQTITFYLKPI